MPFLKPYLPYHDSMRDEPAFVELLIDLDDTSESDDQSWNQKSLSCLLKGYLDSTTSACLIGARFVELLEF